jgi:hypothetical protein
VKVEMEAAEVQSLLEWNLSRRICLASAMRVDSAVTGMAPVLFHGSRSLLGSRLGLISSACNEDCDHSTVGYTGGLQTDFPSLKRAQSSVYAHDGKA